MTVFVPRSVCAKPALMAVGLCVVLSVGAVARADRPSAPRLLPKTTVAYASIPDVPEATERFMNTSSGRMSQNPQLKPLLEEVYGALAQVVDNVKDQTGLSLSEMLAIPQGQITVALVAPDDARPAVVVMLDAGDQLSRVQGLLDRADAAANRAGSESTKQTLHETTIVVYEDGGIGNQGDIPLAYFEKDGTIVVATDPDVLKQILAVWNGEKGATLADNRKFTTIMSRCGDPSQKPQLVWFADPIEIMRAFGRENSGLRVAVAMLPSLGLDGVTAAGGAMRMDVDEFDSITHAHLLLAHPRDGVVEAIAFTPGDTTPQRWVPIETVNYMTARLDLEKAYKTVEELFDSFQGDGALAASIEKRMNQPLGMDIREDVLSGLTGRMTYVNWIERPITIQSSALLIALELKQEAEVDKVLEKLQAKFSQVLVEKSYGGNDYYKISPPGVEARLAEARPDQMVPNLPCFGIVDRSFIFADREALFQRVIVCSKESTDKLADNVDYKLITSKIARQSKGATPVMVAFSRPEEAMRFMYDLANGDRTRKFLGEQGKNNPFFKSINSALESNPLPPFAVLEQYLAPSGTFVLDDETGLHYISFALRSESK